MKNKALLKSHKFNHNPHHQRQDVRREERFFKRPPRQSKISQRENSRSTVHSWWLLMVLLLLGSAAILTAEQINRNSKQSNPWKDAKDFEEFMRLYGRFKKHNATETEEESSSLNHSIALKQSQNKAIHTGHSLNNDINHEYVQSLDHYTVAEKTQATNTPVKEDNTLLPLHTPTQNAPSPLKIMTNKLSQRIDQTQKAEAFYRQYPSHTFKKDNVQLLKGLRELAREKNVYCKFQTLLDDPSFRIELRSEEEMDGLIAKFVPKTKTIAISVSKISDLALKDFLRHEAHHAWTHLQNEKNNRFFLLSTGKPPAWPCDVVPSRADAADCNKIFPILKEGFGKANLLLQAFNLPYTFEHAATLPKNQEAMMKKLLLNEYLSACKTYKPFHMQISVADYEIKHLQKNGELGKNLAIRTAEGYIKVIDNNDKTTPPYYIVGIKRESGKYVANIRWCAKENDPAAALIDLFTMVHQYKDRTLVDLIMEKDAIAHHLFENHPALFNLFFPRLSDYHLKRSDSDYQRCMKKN